MLGEICIACSPGLKLYYIMHTKSTSSLPCGLCECALLFILNASFRNPQVHDYFESEQKYIIFLLWHTGRTGLRTIDKVYLLSEVSEQRTVQYPNAPCFSF